ncbi:hypothetical protein PENTCL1PPCAC_17600 [Pristionchus entomophagus]|uniref:BTB domain-containing protein n=1 Tax=Pristionchus entomophagus TaxID=358040 RepID=A0AAV5TM19_9BILA|nr:hypothetical protein PENTCL1PPCAC_17600 [Pristionchus entomophagus]
MDWPDSSLLHVDHSSILVLSLHSPFFSSLFYSDGSSSKRDFDFSLCDVSTTTAFLPTLHGVFPKYSHDKVINFTEKIQAHYLIERYEEFVMEQGKMVRVDLLCSRLNGDQFHFGIEQSQFFEKFSDRSIDLPEAILPIIKLYNNRDLLTNTDIVGFLFEFLQKQTFNFKEWSKLGVFDYCK